MSDAAPKKSRRIQGVSTNFQALESYRDFILDQISIEELRKREFSEQSRRVAAPSDAQPPACPASETCGDSAPARAPEAPCEVPDDDVPPSSPNT